MKHFPRANRAPISAFERWLMVIGALKLAEALLFVLIGVGVIRVMHRGLVDVLTHLIVALHRDPEGRFTSLLLAKAALLSPHRLKEISAAAFAHSALDILEGVGLILRQVWAEFITLGVSVLFLPFEIFSLARHATWIKVGIIVVNLAVVVYLALHVRMRLRHHAEMAVSRGS